MPKLGAGVYKEGVILRWFKREGEAIREREPLAEIETEKAVVTYESPLSGTVLKLITPEGASVQVGAPVCVIGDPGESVPPDLIHKDVGKFEHPETIVKSAAGLTPSLQVSPAAKRLAETMKMNLKAITGTGAGGMIMREDVLRTARSPSAPPRQDRQQKLVRLSTMRATIAERLLKSQRETAHVTLTREVEVGNLVSLVKGKLANSGITYTDVLIKVAAEALKRHPMVNAQLEGDEIRILDQININFAVAVEAGLITPTVRAVDKLSLTEVSRLARELSERARERKLESTDYADGTFTISNLGMFGVDAFTPIINPPQVAILGTGRILERPWAENGQLTALPTMYLSLTFDHRIVDGADAARFLDTVVSLLTGLDWLR
jgi:pyruvate dehydrogenase E2 component (dihydrolipoamide acetyltransferase)